MQSIVFVLSSLEVGGAERVALTLLAGLDCTRFAPELIVLGADGPLAELVPAEVPLHTLRQERLRHAFPALIRNLRKREPAVIYSTLGHVNLALAAAKPILARGFRLVIREANLPSMSLRTQPHPRLFALAYWLLYSTADHVIASSQRMAEELECRFRVSPENLSILPNPVDVDGIRRRIRKFRRYDGDGPHLIAAGRLTHQKGFDRLISLMPKLAPDVHIVILGDGPERTSLKRLSERLGVGRRVAFAGFQSNPWEWYAASDAYVMPSRWEGMPNAALEALACGTPVIATPESGGLVEVAENVSAGSITIARIGEAFTAALGRIRARHDQGLRPSLLPPRFECANVVRDFMAILDSLPAGRSG